MFLLYNLLLTFLAPIWVPWMWIRSMRRKEKPNWKERQGMFDLAPRGETRRIWVHTVSVGEFLAAKPVLKAIRRALPRHEIIVSVTTSSGHQTAREAEAGLFDHLVYFPIDIARFQLAAMQRVQPDVVAIMETELWMNFLWAAKTFDAQTVLMNGRISDRSYPRARKVAFFYRALLKDMDQCLMQTEADRERIVSLGARSAAVMGNCKFDQALEEATFDVDAVRADLKLLERPVIVIGSTRGEMEERFVLAALERVGFDAIQVVHAPRHLERVDALAALAPAPARRSKGESGPYLILDTYGELSRTYAAADLVIIGGGFDNLGGQNLIQPLAHGKPVLHGPHMQNFRDVAEMADRVGAAITCATPDDLAEQIRALLGDPARREQMALAARQLVAENIGASDRIAEAIRSAAKLAQQADDARKRRRRA